MARKIDAGGHLGYRLPSINGASLAEAVMQVTDVPWSDIVIDAHRCPPELLISAFYNSFWQRIYEIQPQRLEEAKAIPWEFDYEVKQEVLEYLRDHFKPREPA
jgi:hypothetical protein